jgi:PAS domain S-box-containing protein
MAGWRYFPLGTAGVIDSDARTVFANEQVTEILGAGLSEMLGQPSFAYVFPEDVPAAQVLFEAKGHGNAFPFRFKLRRQDGSPVWADVQANPMHSAEGTFKGIVGTFTVSEFGPVRRAKL